MQPLDGMLPISASASFGGGGGSPHRMHMWEGVDSHKMLLIERVTIRIPL